MSKPTFDWTDDKSSNWGNPTTKEDEYLSSRPSDPNYTSLKPLELLQTLPPQTQSILKKSVEAPVTGDEYERLGVFLESVMQRGENPFPIVRLFKLHLGRGVNAVLDEHITKKLDHYWHHWVLPPRSPSPVLEEACEQNAASFDFFREKLRNPTTIPGVSVSSTGKCQAGSDTLRWMRSTAYVMSRRGNSEVVPELLENIKEVFGDEAYNRAFNKQTMDRLKKAENTFIEEFNAKKAMGVKHPMDSKEDPALSEMKYLVKNFEISMLPKPPTMNGALTDRSVYWLREKLIKFAKNRINPDPFISILIHIFGPNNMRLIFNPQFSVGLKAEICDLSKPPLRGIGSSLDNITEWIRLGQTLPPPQPPFNSITQSSGHPPLMGASAQPPWVTPHPTVRHTLINSLAPPELGTATPTLNQPSPMGIRGITPPPWVNKPRQIFPGRGMPPPRHVFDRPPWAGGGFMHDPRLMGSSQFMGMGPRSMVRPLIRVMKRPLDGGPMGMGPPYKVMRY